MSESRPLPSLKIELSEVPAWTLIPRETYDDSGFVLGPNPDYEREVESVKGLNLIQMRLQSTLELGSMSVPSTMHLRSRSYPADNKLDKEHALKQAFRAAIDSYVHQVLLT